VIRIDHNDRSVNHSVELKFIPREVAIYRYSLSCLAALVIFDDESAEIGLIPNFPFSSPLKSRRYGAQCGSSCFALPQPRKVPRLRNDRRSSPMTRVHISITRECPTRGRDYLLGGGREAHFFPELQPQLPRETEIALDGRASEGGREGGRAGNAGDTCPGRLAVCRRLNDPELRDKTRCRGSEENSETSKNAIDRVWSTSTQRFRNLLTRWS